MVSGPFTRAELARLVGISVEELQAYQERRLLQPPRRRRGRPDDLAFHREHAERLSFIKRALSVGYSLEDIAKLVDPHALVTCRDVFETTVGSAQAAMYREPQRAQALAQIAEICPRVGSRNDCPIVRSLTMPYGTGAQPSARKGTPWRGHHER